MELYYKGLFGKDKTRALDFFGINHVLMANVIRLNF